MSSERPSVPQSAIRFEQVPIVEGPLSLLQEGSSRDRIVSEVVRRTRSELQGGATESLLSEALFSEKGRLRRQRPNWYTKSRHQEDRRLWKGIHEGLLQPGARVGRDELLDRVLSHYGSEICGKFDPRVYWFATRSVPWMFNWLLNAASVQRFLPWGMTEALESRVRLVGEIAELQSLSKKGTVLMVPTHQSNIDSPLVGYLIYLMQLPPFAYGAGLNLFTNPLLGFLMSRLGAYTVDRAKNNAIYKQALKNYSTAILSEGVHSIFFPGGGRSRSGAIESRLKLGLLGTGLEAQILNLRAGREKPNIYVVPMVMSYHFVLEASSLIEDYLAASGKHRYIMTDDESSSLVKVLQFFWRFFGSQSSLTVRIGRAMDVFGNFVDSEGRSQGPNGTTIDPRQWLMSGGEVRADAQRDREYTRELGERIAERFHRDNTVLTSHLVAFAFFELLREQNPSHDLFRLLRLPLAQRTVQESVFLTAAERYRARLLDLASRGLVYLSPELLGTDVQAWVRDGVRNLGLLHGHAVLRWESGWFSTEDMALLYYYRNRLAGYGLSRLAESTDKRRGDLVYAGRERERDYDSQGFLV
jgi:glycerol-3-phosphate O-acyltransferase